MLKVRQLGKHPVLHTAMSSVGLTTPRLDDSKNALTISEQTFRELHSRLLDISVDASELPTLLAEQKRKLRERIEKRLASSDQADVDHRRLLLHGLRIRMFRVLLRFPEGNNASSTVFSYELRRYVLKYSESKRETHYRDKDGVTAQYVMRVHYALEHRHATQRRAEAFVVQCSCNATSLEGESGSAFASAQLNLTPEEWEQRLADAYRRPYRILEKVAGMTRGDLQRLSKPHEELQVTRPFTLGVSKRQMMQAITIQTFGFRWLANVKHDLDVPYDPRELMLLMLFMLYNSKQRFLHRDVGVGHDMNIEVEISRKSDQQDGLFEYASVSVPRAVDERGEDDVDPEDPMATRVGQAFAKHRKNPVVGLRIKVKDYRRAGLYTVSFHVPSEKYLRLLYRFTDALSGPPSEAMGILDTWKAMAKYGIVIGVDAYSGYLRNRRNIVTLRDLVHFFVEQYDRDIQKFCQYILEAAYKDIDIQYWLGSQWMNMLQEPKVAAADAPVWKWLVQNADLNIIDYMIKKRLLTDVPDVGGILKPTREHLKTVKGVVDYWRRTYGYDPSYSWGAHSGVIRAWYHIDDPRKFYEAERRGVPIANKAQHARALLNKGTGRMLPSLIAMPIRNAALNSTVK